MSKKQEFLALAQPFVSGKYNVGGWFASEKLDGMRVFYDGGISRGLKATEVPYANTTKHARFVEEKVATGLWTRYGQVVHAPDWWLDQLPNHLLDGELYMGKNNWQALTSTVKQHVPDARWNDVKYWVFDSPHYSSVFADRIINIANFKKGIKGAVQWAAARLLDPRFPETMDLGIKEHFAKVNEIMSKVDLGKYAAWLPQTRLVDGHSAADRQISELLTVVENLGGEGLIVRNPYSYWLPERNGNMFKVKTCQDAEGMIVGFKFAKPTDMERSISGKQTDKLLGKMGSLLINYKGNQFELSGFTDAEREVSDPEYAKLHPGEIAPNHIKLMHFRIGEEITFKYRELSKDKLPKEARYLRKAQ